MRRIDLSVIVAVAWGSSIACGARTDAGFVADSIGGPLGSGDTASSGGNGNGGGGGYGGFAGSYAGSAGYAGSVGGGCFGCGGAAYGGYAGSSGGFAGSDGGVVGYGGTNGGCVYPYCSSCGDCLSSCLCYGNDKTSCYDACYGVGGSPATGGAAGGSACDPSFCPQSPAGEPITLQGCCTFSGACGIDTAELAGFVPVPSGCEDSNEPGVYDPTCPSMPTPIGQTLAGCCRPDGTCGNDLSALGLGCLTSTVSGGLQFCGFGGFPSTGGQTSTGGFIGAGGAIATGGFIGAGGTFATGGISGAGGAAAECLSEARSACETCACSSCSDSFLSCFRDAGCPQILQCANQTGCNGTNCFAANTCETVINANGGPLGGSVALAEPLFQCLASAGCPCGFAAPGQ